MSIDLGHIARQHHAAPQVTRAIQTASAQSGVDFSYLMTKAAMESSFNPQARAAGSSATGLFQFVDQTWLDMVRQHGAKYGLGDAARALADGTADAGQKQDILALRNDPRLSALMAAEYTRSNQDYLEAKVGDVGNTELYLAHFLGPGGAEKFIRAMRADPSAPAAGILPEAASANRAVFFENGRQRSLEEVFGRFAARFEDGLQRTAGLRSETGTASGLQAATSSTASAASAFWPGSTATSMRLSYETQLLLLALAAPGMTGGDSVEDNAQLLRSYTRPL